MHWYHLFALAVFALWLGATDADRNALRIVLAVTIASLLVVDLWTSHLTGSWKLAVPGVVETVTIIALIRWSRNRTGFIQAGCVLAAWLAHALCFADLRLGTDLVYSHYEGILAAVAGLQLAFFHETYLHHFRRLGHWWGSLGADRGGAVHAPGYSTPVFHHPRDPRVL
jgi:hypothetical protein